MFLPVYLLSISFFLLNARLKLYIKLLFNIAGFTWETNITQYSFLFTQGEKYIACLICYVIVSFVRNAKCVFAQAAVP